FEDLFLNPLNQLLRARPEELDRCNILRCAVSQALEYMAVFGSRKTGRKFSREKSSAFPASI
ncbi:MULTISPECIES: hypothetical protein, partial [unclassified Variovorax]|uniref:hypothetical protein n=1 Tax=unclassified Variovorax TaxID=663243 RepID=UPI001C43471E